MNKQKIHRVTLQPIRAGLRAAAGSPLRDLLFERGVEFPCGGHGRCRGCKVRVLSGHCGVNRTQEEQLSLREIAEGWRLACQCVLTDDLVIELRQWDVAVLADETPFTFTPRPGVGVVVDLGTTTVVSQLLDLTTGRVLGVRTALNAQARYGADIMSRVRFAVIEQGQAQLERLIRRQIGSLIRQLLASSGRAGAELSDVVIVGNTVMHHLFCSIDVTPLSHYPFSSGQIGLQVFSARQLEWDLDGDPTVRFLPCLGGFVGSDTLAGVLATGLHESGPLVGLVDLGTNGEIVIGNRERILCASAAAGPAFEGARISAGMRAATGAIAEVSVEQGKLRCRVLGNVPPRGICGSGLVDAVAAGLELGLISATGRLASAKSVFELCPPIRLTQQDIRELQLAKAAIAAGIRVLLRRWGASLHDLARLYLAGAFGNYVNHQSAQRIGLLCVPTTKVKPSGNTALLGAKLALFDLGRSNGSYPEVRAKIEHISLSADPSFQDSFVEEMTLPSPAKTE